MQNLMDDLVRRGDVMDELVKEYNRRWQEGGLKLAWIEKAVDSVSPVCRQSAKRLSGLIRDINPAEIESQIEAGNLRQWCEIIQSEMRMAMEDEPKEARG